VQDCALILDAIAGFDALDPDSVDVPLLDFTASLVDHLQPEAAIQGTRIGIPNRYFFRSIDPEVEQAVLAAVQVFTDLGASVEEVEIPESIDEMYGVYRAIMRPEAYTFHEQQGWLATRAELYRPDVLEAINSGSAFSARDYIRAQRARREFSTGLDRAFNLVDALITPTLPEPARSVDRIDEPAVYDGITEPAGYALRYTFPFNLSGQPALSIPCGFTAAGLPIGLQLVADHFGEPTLLRLGHSYQRVTDWHTRMPPLPASSDTES
jgi:aspartyl-tRNA(Asn)/glutamyl-tRNA(Gln) amidotransferase subunit A